MPYFAHSGLKSDASDWQRLDDHALCVARLAADFAAPMGLERAAYLAGLLHDLGKYTSAFQAQLLKTALGQPETLQRVQGTSGCHGAAEVRWVHSGLSPNGRHCAAVAESTL
ncbi:MAG: CRISPR-associated endonuclease Cas3'' [Alphaproteobacteria bacterium]|nr:CRISPR-associated endonuclease Cas3'' [Alphaproteobacteria bacterium]